MSRHDAPPTSATLPTILIRSDGVGPITVKTTLEQLERAFPDLERDSERRLDLETDRELDHTWFSSNGQHVLMVVTDRRSVRSSVVKVLVGHPSAATAAGARPMQTVAEIARIYPDLKCTYEKRTSKSTRHGVALERVLEGISCATPKLPRVTFSPASQNERPPGPIEIDLISDLIVSTIVWRP